MLSVPSALQTQFEERLRNKAIPKEVHWLYRKWLRYYLDFCRKYRFPAGEKESLSPFLRKLEEKRLTKAQLEQARESIALYREILDRKGRDAPLTKAKTVLSDASWRKGSESAAAPGRVRHGAWVRETTPTYSVVPEGKGGGETPGVLVHPEPGIQRPAFFLPTCLAEGVREGRRRCQGEAQTLHPRSLIS
jgi:hypothetical protein